MDKQSPLFKGEPVIVVHVEDPPGSGRAACCGQPFLLPSNYYKTIPLVPCPGCIGYRI